MVGLLGCERTLPLSDCHVGFLINQQPQVFLLKDVLNPFSAQPIFLLGNAPTHGTDLALDLVELHEVPTSPPLNPVKVPLDGIPFLQRVSCNTELGVTGEPAEGAFNPLTTLPTKILNSTIPGSDL